jgi:hypothetical protein
MKSIIGYQRI